MCSLHMYKFKKKEKTCNCKAEACPLNKYFLANNLIYKATVKTENITKFTQDQQAQLLNIDSGIIKQASTIYRNYTVHNYQTIFGKNERQQLCLHNQNIYFKVSKQQKWE